MMARGPEIRRIRIDDLRAVFLLGGELLPASGRQPGRAWNGENLATALAAGMECSFVAVRKKKIVGFIIAAPGRDGSDDRAVTLLWLCAPQGGDAGVGESLLDALVQEAAENNRPCIRVEIGAENDELFRLYKKFGFTESKHLLIMENFPPKMNG